jgi:hypothetical protein
MHDDVGADGGAHIEELKESKSGQEQYETQGRGLESLKQDYTSLRQAKLRADVWPEGRDGDQSCHDRQYGGETKTKSSDS